MQPPRLKKETPDRSQLRSGANEKGRETTTPKNTPAGLNVKAKGSSVVSFEAVAMSTKDWSAIHQIVTKTCFDDLSLIVSGRDLGAREAFEDREKAWDKELGISSYDSQASVLLHLSNHPNQLVLVVNDGNGMLEGWYENGNEEETWDFIVKAEELGLAEVKGIAIQQGIYQMPQRSDDKGTIEFFHLLSEKNQTQQQGKE
jgi:hypothetical protein